MVSDKYFVLCHSYHFYDHNLMTLVIFKTTKKIKMKNKQEYVRKKQIEHWEGT